jgi:cytochrome P450
LAQMASPAGPVRLEEGVLVVTRFDDVSAVMRSSLFTHDVTYLLLALGIPPEQWPYLLAQHPNNLFMWLAGKLRADGSGGRHGVMRNAVANHFSREAISALMPLVDARIQELLSGFGPPGFDLAIDFSRPLSNWLSARLVGITEDEAEEVTAYVAKFARRELSQILEPEEDLIPLLDSIRVDHREDQGTLLADVLSDERLSREEMRAIVFGLVGAGVDTLASLIAFIPAIQAYDFHSEARLQAQQGNRQWFLTAAGELERMCATFPQVPLFGVEAGTFEGFEVRAGTQVIADLAAANRCPEVNGDRVGPSPLEFVPTRHPNHSLTMGVPGTRHSCLGGDLATSVLVSCIRHLYGSLSPWECDLDQHNSEVRGLVRSVTSAPIRF